ncbi:MAG: hypothetical protein GY906_23310 [bacterium]|nr:hypothetical protein [bacterium]
MSLTDRIREARGRGQNAFGDKPGGSPPSPTNTDKPQDILRVRLGNNGDQIGTLTSPEDAGFADTLDKAVGDFQRGRASEQQMDLLERFADVFGIKG